MLSIRRFGWNMLDVEAPIGRGTSLRILERPGVWMPDAELARLSDELRAVAAAAVPHGSLEYGVLTGDRDHLARALVTIAYESAGRRPVAFSAMAYLPIVLDGRAQQVVHLGLALVCPDARGRGLSRSVYGVTMFLVCLRRWFRPIWVTSVSQVPSAIGSFATYFDTAYPRLEASHPTPRHLEIAAQVMANHRRAFGVGDDAEFDAEQFIIRNAYTGGSDHLKKSYTEATRHRRSSYGQWCLTQLDYERGDDFLQIGRYSLMVAARCLTRRFRHRVARLVGALRRRITPGAEPGQLGYPR